MNVKNVLRFSDGKTRRQMGEAVHAELGQQRRQAAPVAANQRSRQRRLQRAHLQVITISLAYHRAVEGKPV